MLASVYQSVGPLVAMVVLLAGSGYFSGSETALFNLTRRQIKQLNSSSHKVQRLLSRLLTKPGLLLNCLLLGNMTVNVLYFAVSSVLVLGVKQRWGMAPASGLALATFLGLVLLGEIIPKSLAYRNSWPVALATTLPTFICVQVFGPVAFLYRILFLEPVLRVVLGHRRRPDPITLGEFRSLIDLSRRRGVISADENRLLAEVVELSFLKIRHVMLPRVDMVACEVSDPPSLARQKMQKHGLTRIPIYVRDIDNVAGFIHRRQLLLRPNASLDSLVQPIQIVPEQKTVESLLEFFRKTGTDMAIVVDEYGGIAGSVRLEDVADELLGGPEIAGGEPIEQLGPFQYRLSGDLAVHDWADVFDIDLEETRLSTIGGLVTALLGTIPKTGDEAVLGNLRFKVERVRKHRIETVVLSLDPISDSN